MKRTLEANHSSLETVCFLFFLLLSLLIYANSLKADFLLDDWYVVASNPAIKQPALYGHIFTRGFFDSYTASSHFELNTIVPLFFFPLPWIIKSGG